MSGQGAELERARNVQLTMLPEVPAVSGLEVASSYRACDLLGGDFYDFILVDSWRLGIVIADVSGHGTAAALLMAAAKKVMQMCGRGVLSPREMVLEVNNSIRADIPRGMFLTVFYGIIDIRNYRLCFVSCGHNPPLLRRANQVKDRWTHDNAPPVGIVASDELGRHLKEETVQLQPEDMLLLYTDGLTEAFNDQKAMYGEERLMQHLVRTTNVSAKQLVDTVRHDVDTFRGKAVQSDDETLIAVRVTKHEGDPKPLMPEIAVAASKLPEFALPLIGRSVEVASLVRQLKGDESRIFTVTGPPGAGKTRVAVEAAETVQTAFLGGTYFVDLQSARSLADVCRLVAGELKLSADGSQLGVRIARALQSSSGRSLLLLDNCEGAIEGVQRCIREWRNYAKDLTIITTSRRPLDLDGESILALKPLKTPNPDEKRITPDTIGEFPAIALFVRRARKAEPSFRLTNENARDIARICTRLDGVPQAIEMAAGRVAVLSPHQILERLDSRFELLRSTDGDRHETLQAALEWSYELLTRPEQTALVLLSCFPDGFQIDVANRVLEAVPGVAAEDLVRSLIRHSLVHYDKPEELEGERRFYVYESVRMFARGKLTDPGSAKSARERFESSLLDYALGWWRKDQEGGSPAARRRIQTELEGLLKIARNTTSPESRARASFLAAPILHRQGEQDRAINLLRRAQEGLTQGSDEWLWVHVIDANLRALEAPENVLDLLEGIEGDDLVNFMVLSTRSYALNRLGKVEEAIETIQQAARIPGLHPLKRALVKERLATFHAELGEMDEAQKGFESALRIAREQGDSSVEGRILYDLGWFNLRRHQPEDAVKHLRESLRMAQMDGDRTLEANVLGSLALGLHLTGEKQQAEASMLRALRICREVGRPFSESAHLNTLARIYHEQGRDEEALEACIQARDLSREIGAKQSEAISEGNIAALQMALGHMDVALEALENAYQILLDLQDNRAAMSALANIGNYYAKRWEQGGQKRDLLTAIDKMQEACDTRREYGFDPMVETELTLAELLRSAGKRRESRGITERVIESVRNRPDSLSKKVLKQAQEMLEELDAVPGRGRARLPAGARDSSSSNLNLPVVDAPKRKTSDVNLQPVRPPRKHGSGIYAPVAPRKKGGSGMYPPVQPRKKSGSGLYPPVQPRNKGGTGVFQPVKKRRADGSGSYPPVQPRKKPGAPTPGTKPPSKPKTRGPSGRQPPAKPPTKSTTRGPSGRQPGTRPPPSMPGQKRPKGKPGAAPRPRRRKPDQ